MSIWVYLLAIFFVVNGNYRAIEEIKLLPFPLFFLVIITHLSHIFSLTADKYSPQQALLTPALTPA